MITTRVPQTLLRIWLDARGQDLVEYALLGGFVSVAAAVIFPTTAVPAICTVFSKVLFLLERTVNRMN
jgi:Flp pilus assembly pilin Flp